MVCSKDRLSPPLLESSNRVLDTDICSPHEQTLWCSFCGRTTYFLLRGSLLTVSTISRVVVIHLMLVSYLMLISPRRLEQM
jgi:hypothetical protein